MISPTAVPPYARARRVIVSTVAPTMRNVAAAAAEAGSSAEVVNIRECGDSRPTGVVHVAEEIDSEPSGVEIRKRVVASIHLFMAIGRG